VHRDTLGFRRTVVASHLSQTEVEVEGWLLDLPKYQIIIMRSELFESESKSESALEGFGLVGFDVNVPSIQLELAEDLCMASYLI
jgi:hypothetical protein